MFKKFTDTLSGTLDTVKSYGSSMGIGQVGQAGATAANGTNDRPATSKLSLNLPTLGNGSVSAPATTANSPDRAAHKPSLASNTLLGLQNTLGKITGRGDSTNAAVMASHQSRSGRGPVLGRAVETNETRITEKHTLDDDMKGLNAEDISGYDQYVKFKSTGQLGVSSDYTPLPTSERMNGSAPKLVRSNTDEIIDQQFKAMMGDLDQALDETEQLDELAPVEGKDGEDKEEKKKKKKKKNKHLMKCVRCIQDNRVKGGCVDPEEMADAAEDNLVLKKVLNIVFLVIGILLFLAVFAVIIYTSLAKTKDQHAGGATTTTAAPNTTDDTWWYEYSAPELDPPPEWQTDLADVSADGIDWIRKLKSSMDAMSLPDDEYRKNSELVT